MIQDKYVVKGTELPSKRIAKLNALERFAKQALNRAKQKMALIMKYNGNPPEQVIDNFDKESDTISDAMLDYNLIADENEPEKKSRLPLSSFQR